MTLHDANTLASLTSSNPADRLDGLVRYVVREVESSAAAVALVTGGRTHSLAAAAGYQQPTVDYLLGQFAYEDPGMQVVYAHPGQLLTWDDIPSYRSTFSAEHILIPAGFHEGTSIAIPDSSGRTVAVLHISVTQPAFPLWLRDFVEGVLRVAVSIVCALQMRSRANLTQREVEVLRYLADGLTNTAIGDVLYLSRSTVNTHVEHILRKLEAKNRLSAAVLAHKWGLLDDPA